jgi:fibronectin-binding autotransporter adhesin
MKTSILRAALLLAAATTVQAASSTWNGTVSSAWTNAANWLPGIPATGDDVVIADTTSSGNALSLTDSRSIGSLTFGATGTRTTAFQITNNVAANSLTFTNGLVANGAIGGVISFFRIPTIIDADQTWSIGGAPGAVTSDWGMGVTPRANGTQTPFTLNANLTKTGTGQLTFIGANITGNGNLTINQGVVKFNGGSSTTMSASGGGSIVINSGGKLMLFRNSGAVTCTKPIALNAGGTLEFGGNNTGGATYGFPLTMSGNVTFSSGGGVAGQKLYTLTGAWSGNAAISGTAVGSDVVVLVLSNNITGWTGSFNHAGNAFRIAFAAAAPGNAAVAWSLNNAGAILETYGATNVQLGSLGGSSGTLRNSDPGNQPATVTVGALNTSTTLGAVMADNTASLGLVKVGTGTLTLTANNTFSGGTVISNGAVLLQGATASSGSANVAVRSGATFGGSSGTASGGATLDAGGTLRLPGGIGATPLTVGGLNFGASSTDTPTTTVDVYSGGKAACTGGLNVNGTNIINLIGGVPAVGVYDVITYSGAIGGSGFAGFKLGSLQPGVVANLQDSGTAIQVNVTATGQPGVWVGNLLSQWNLQGGLEWKGLTSGTPQAYLDFYPVFFDDTRASFAVNITENVTPALVNVSNTTAYTFSGAGGVIGNAGLIKDGPGTLTIVNSNSYSGGTYITNGTVQLGNGGTSGSIGDTVNNNGVLIFNRSDALTLNGISGAGSIEQRGTGITTVGGANSYTGLAIIATGTLAAGSGSALGVIDSGTVVSNGATLDVNSQNLGAEPVNAQGGGVGGAGALVNNGPGDQTSAFRYVTLDGPTTFGGARRWDIRVPTVANDPNGGTDAFLHGNGYNLTKVNSNIVAFISAGDTALGDIDIQGGTLTFSRSTMMGDSSKKITVRSNATLRLHRTSEFINPNILNKVVSMTNAIFDIEGNGLANNQFAGPVTLSDSNVFNLPSATGLNLTGPVNGSGSATVIGPGTLVVSGNATYTGGTTLNGAVLQVDGTLGSGAQALAITAASTVGGNGTINYSVTVPAGSALSPGAHSSVSLPGTTLGGLTINNTLTLQAGCSNIFEINKDAGTNDTVRGLTSVTLAGTLVLQNVGSTAYAPGDNFRLFSAGSYSGGFATIVPATPAPGLIWLTNSLTVNGTLGVAVLPNPVALIVSSASSVVSTNVNVLFSAELDPNTAQDPANYVMSTSNQVVTATLVNPTNVLLGLDSPITNATYTLKVQSVKDLAYIPNVVVTTNVPGVAIGFLEAFRLGNITNGSAFAYGTNSQIKVYADGSDIFGTQDNGEFVYKYVTGDFDLSVRLESLLITDPAAKAGIMARDVTDPTFPLFADRDYMVAAFSPDPTRNNNLTQYREDSGGTTVAPAAPRPAATYPNNWLRLKRTGSVMQGYSGPNGLSWTPMTAVDSATNAAGPYPETIRVGLAVTSHNAAQTTEAVFSKFGNASEGVLLSAAASGSDLVLSWPLGTGATLQATPGLNPPVTWTNVPGSDTTNLVQLPIGSANSFFRLVK